MDWKIEESIEKAKNGISKLTPEILSIEGMSSAWNRYLLNNLAGAGEINYLEVGVHQGSTFVSALYGNNIKNAYAIDDWSQFGNVEVAFKENCSKFNINYKFFGVNCMAVNPACIKDINFYFYDGHHGDYVTTDALTHFYDSLSDEFLYIADDYNWKDIGNGVLRGIERCNLKIKEQIILLNEGIDDKKWWNGIGIFVLSK